MVTMDSKTLGTLASFGLSGIAGDTLVLGAACIYALATVRLATYAQKFDPMEIAAARTNAATVISVLWFLWDYAGTVFCEAVQPSAPCLCAFKVFYNFKRSGATDFVSLLPWFMNQ